MGHTTNKKTNPQLLGKRKHGLGKRKYLSSNNKKRKGRKKIPQAEEDLFQSRKLKN